MYCAPLRAVIQAKDIGGFVFETSGQIDPEKSRNGSRSATPGPRRWCGPSPCPVTPKSPKYSMHGLTFRCTTAQDCQAKCIVERSPFEGPQFLPHSTFRVWTMSRPKSRFGTSFWISGLIVNERGSPRWNGCSFQRTGSDPPNIFLGSSSPTQTRRHGYFRQ